MFAFFIETNFGMPTLKVDHPPRTRNVDSAISYAEGIMNQMVGSPWFRAVCIVDPDTEETVARICACVKPVVTRP